MEEHEQHPSCCRCGSPKRNNNSKKDFDSNKRHKDRDVQFIGIKRSSSIVERIDTTSSNNNYEIDNVDDDSCG